jgi:Kef-type K+ transport system membrane component KefB
VPQSGNLINDLAPRIELLIVELLLPLYFASSGLKTDISKLDTGMLWGMTIAITCVSIVAKTLPVTLLARAFDRKKKWRHCLARGY